MNTSLLFPLLLIFAQTEVSGSNNSDSNKILNEVNYSISFQKPYTHYCEVEINLINLESDSVIFSMPVWTPGSYLVREFAKNVESVYAEDSKGQTLHVEKINKNSWKVNSKIGGDIKFGYKVYCNEFSVRTSEVNMSHAFISNAGAFMRVNGYENRKCILKINLPSQWKSISTGLSKESANVYYADNYDVFIDSPIEIGNQTILEFEVKNVKHYICLSGEGNYKEDILLRDFRTIAEEQIKLFAGDIPYKDYTFIIHLVEKGGGGLEHLNSFVAQVPRLNFNDIKLYKKFLGLVSHEFFHLWNVKRIKPHELGPFDYDRENYTKSLWIAEGWTSFYDNVFLRRANLISNKEYFELLDSDINDIMRFEGRFIQSLQESSFDTWIKYYRKDENYNNSQVSYYTKGSLVAFMLNLDIIKSTEGKKSLDDVLRELYQDYTNNSKGYTEDRVKQICETIAGKSLDNFWNDFIRGTAELPLESYLNDAGLKLKNENDTLPPDLGIETRSENGRVIISKVFAGGSGYESGLNFNDEIIAINGMRMNPDLMKTVFQDFSEFQEIKVLINRNGLVNEMNVKLLKPLPKFKIEEIEEKTAEQEVVLNKWIAG